MSGAAIFISLCTLVVLLYEAHIMREQQRASVWPYVEIGVGFRDDGFHLYTYNQGVGPARIRSMQVRVSVEMCYCSVYDECWRVVLRKRDAKREAVAACQPAPEIEFAQ